MSSAEKRKYVNECIATLNYTRLGKKSWWIRPRSLLEGRTPDQAWADGDEDLVVALAEWLRDNES